MISSFLDCIDAKFGEHTFAKNTFEITRKCNQKCIDSNKRLKIKTEVDKTVEANKENLTIEQLHS